MQGPITALFRQPMLLLALTALFWAGNAVASRLAVGEVSPFLLVFLRWSIVCLLLLPFLWRRILANWASLRPRLKVVVFMALFGFTGFNALFYIAAHSTTALNIGIIQGAIPIFVLLAAFAAYRTPVSLVQTAGVALTVLGVVLVASQGSLSRLAGLTFNLGDMIMVLACLFYALYATALKNRPAIDGLVFFAFLALIAALASLPLLALEVATGELILPTAKGWVVTAYIALFPSCIAQIFFMRGVDLIGPGRAGVFVNLVPVFAALLAVLILSEPFRWYHAGALTLVLTGIVVAQRKPRQAPAR
ncbi:MAG: DMT family transporter [Limibacillus sp.]|jgi:drug/metabolite transporter (DMT)-like permease